ncbi:hypothetical protein [Spiroplasma endosymbiont of Diplazon laetatorius]|uniref:hypothetical protein n=1 Tax=Spiroplasma endosymbiont of Diplazon laetatorius TaxID=3066322 RepID=UPI0030CD1F77
MKSFSKLKLEFDKNDKGYCKVQLENKSGVNKSGWIKFNDFLNWLFINAKNNIDKIGNISFSEKLIAIKSSDHSDFYFFYYEPSIRDIFAYKKGKYVHKTIFLPQLIAEVKLDKINISNNWNIRLFAFSGELSEKTKFFSMKLPHFYETGDLCLGNLNSLKKIKELNELDNLINYIFSTKFNHEWTEINEEFTKPAHFLKGLEGLKQYKKINEKILFNKR